jgi:predicted RNase H-like HicB family nuclease
MNYRVSIVLEQDESGYFAYSPELPGCYSQGESYEAAVANIKEAVDLYIETLDPEERIQLLSKQISTSSIEVSIA